MAVCLWWSFLSRELNRVSEINRGKRNARSRRHRRLRQKIAGTAKKPRMSVFRSLNHIYAQIIDDEAGCTIVSASSLKTAPSPGAAGEEKEAKKRESFKMQRSRLVGAAIAEKALEKGIDQVVFDRGGFLYHGRIAALAEAARKKGLKF